MTTHAPIISPVQRTRKSPYYDATIELGAKGFTVYNHMLMPTFYDSVETDYWHLINNVTMWDVACERQVEIKGPDAAYLTQYLTPRNLAKMKVGQCKYAPIVDENGGMLNDPVLLKLSEDRFWLSVADSDLFLWAKGVAMAKGLDVIISEPDVSPLAIQGPKANDVAAALLGEWVRDLRFFWFRPFNLEGIPMIVARSGWSKQGGVELYLQDSSMGESLWKKVWQAGQPFGIAPGAPNAIERIESGLLSYGNDMTIQNNPFEIGLGTFCDLDQEADFIGKAALQHIRATGVSQKLVGFILNGDPISRCEHYWPILADREVVGKITSATYSPRLKQNIGLGYVPLALIEPGSQVTAATQWGERTAEVARIPFI